MFVTATDVEPALAIYSCNLASIGRTTHAAGTAGAHLRYIAREGAEPVLEAHAIPIEPARARSWMDREEAADRKNARVLDKVRLALPRELTPEQRQALVREFCEGVTGNRVPWMFAIHQEGKDAHNPHAHVVIRDRDLETGKRVLRLSDSAKDRAAAGLEPKAVEWIRTKWEEHANRALERAGHEARIDRRSLEAQGIDRAPTIHIGPRAQHIDTQVQRPVSKVVTDGRGRQIDYPMIDAGRTRRERQGEIIDLNLERGARSPDFETREWAKFEKVQRAADRVLESQLTAEARRRTMEERRLKAGFRQQSDEIRAQRRAAYQTGIRSQREALSPALAELRERQRQAREDLARQQRSFWGRFSAAIDLTGGTRRRQEDARRALTDAHKAERRRMAEGAASARAALREALGAVYGPQEVQVRATRLQALSALQEGHKRAQAAADAKRQLREAEREQERQRTAAAIRTMKALNRPRPDDNLPAASPALSHSQDQARAGFEAARTPAQEAEERRRQEILRRLEEMRRQQGRGPGLSR